MGRELSLLVPLSSTYATKGHTLAQVTGTKEILFCAAALPGLSEGFLSKKTRIQDGSNITMSRGKK